MILSSYINRLRNSRFVANLATLSFGTIVAQVIPFVATLVLSRLYIPEEMGEWGVFSSYASILAIVGTLRYDGAIVKSRNVADAYILTYISLFFSFVYCGILLVIAFGTVVLNIETGMDTSVMWLLPLYIAVLIVVQIFTNLSTYLREYRLNARNSIERSFVQAISRILLGFLKFYRKGMILGAVIGGAITAVSFATHLNVLKNRKYVDKKRFISLLKENKDFPKYDLPSNLLNSISSHCPPILLSYFFFDYVVGIFSMALTLLYMPMSVIGYSVSQLYYKDASEQYHSGGSLSSLTRRLFVSLFLGSLGFMIVMMLLEHWLFGFVLGSKWVEVGKYATLLSPWLLLVTALSPLSTIFYVKGEQRLNMNLNLAGLMVRGASIILIAYFFKSSDTTILAFGIASTLFYIVQGYYILRLGEVHFSQKDAAILIPAMVLFLIIYIWKTVLFLKDMG